MKVVPAGVQIGGVRVGGLTSEQARNAISWWYNRPLRFVFYGKHWTVRPTALGASVDADSAVQRVLRAQPNEHVALRVDAEADATQAVRARARRAGSRSSRSTRRRAWRGGNP